MKNLNVISGLLIIFTSFFSAGCNLSGDKDKVIKVSPEFTVDMFEELGDTRKFQFKIASVELQSCTNYSIGLSGQRSGGLITLNISDIQSPAECLTGEGPAKAVKTIGFLPNGFYTLHINLKNTILNIGRLQVTEEAYLLEMDTDDGIEIIHKELKRIPARTIWGYVGYNDKDAVGNQADNFIADLENLAQYNALKKGFYGYFNLDENHKPVLTPSLPFTYFKTFLFSFDKNVHELESLLETYRSGPAGEEMEIKVTTWEGETL